MGNAFRQSGYTTRMETWLKLAASAIATRIMTGVKLLLRVTPRRLNLAAGVYYLKEEQKLGGRQ